MQNIDVGLEEAFHGPLTGIDANRVASEDTSNFDTITGLADIHKFFIGTQRD